jgi:predicted transcriptional regulator
MADFGTSLKLPKDLKSRIARLAKRSGQSPHAFMLQMLEERVEDAERFERLIEDAREADRHMQETGKGFAADDVHEYLQAKVEGRAVGRPKPVRWPR